jgi:monofunctional biosynthetic peptidoglycan transglycosylase
MFKRVYLFLLKAMIWFFGVSIALVVVFKFVPIPFTPLMVIRAIENKIDGNDMVCSHDWEPIDNISVNLQKAVIASEDARFLTHKGFDFDAIQKAMENNEKGKKLKGGSTISQQTAKNVLIEIIWGKERIMEVYLNSIEMGDGVYGAEAATQYWYRKECSNLTKIEAAGIAAILPNPRKFKASNSSAFINARKARIVKRMRQVGKLQY